MAGSSRVGRFGMATEGRARLNGPDLLQVRTRAPRSWGAPLESWGGPGWAESELPFSPFLLLLPFAPCLNRRGGQDGRQTHGGGEAAPSDPLSQQRLPPVPLPHTLHPLQRLQPPACQVFLPLPPSLKEASGLAGLFVLFWCVSPFLETDLAEQEEY